MVPLVLVLELVLVLVNPLTEVEISRVPASCFLLAGWLLAGWLVGWLAGWLGGCCLAAWLLAAGWWLVGWLVGPPEKRPPNITNSVGTLPIQPAKAKPTG